MSDATWQDRMREATGVVRVPRDVKRKRARAKANQKGVRRPVQADQVPVLEPPTRAKESRLRIEAARRKASEASKIKARRDRAKASRRANR